MNYNCCKCGSDQTQKLSAIYASGTSHNHTTALTSGIIMQNTGAVGGLSATTSTSSTSRSLLADRLAPPQRLTFDPSASNPGGCLIIVLAIATTFAIATAIDHTFFLREEWITGWMGSSDPVKIAVDHPEVCFVISLFGGLAALMGIARGIRNKSRKFDTYNEAVYEPAMKEWKKKFYCHRCDTIFKPDA